jgi:ribulose-phosphate 3-epimerase
VVINPATPVHALDEVLHIVHHVLVMSVNPGFGGETFIHSSLRKFESESALEAAKQPVQVFSPPGEVQVRARAVTV